MPEQLTFAIGYEYDSLQVGITVPVRLRTWSESIDLHAKIDTGASLCIFERKHAEQLGLNVESGAIEKLSTATGIFIAYGHEVTLDVLGIETTTTVYFAADENFTRNVLGRQGWLDRVRLGLVDYEGKLFLSDYNDPAESAL
ncbi:MAG: hypothetical protein JNM09_13585 [Blastocatellia bacterium]|nr:hypothetical protein [Blastocatellia bacterium]